MVINPIILETRDETENLKINFAIVRYATNIFRFFFRSLTFHRQIEYAIPLLLQFT